MMLNDQSYVQTGPAGVVAYVGPDGVEIARLIMLKNSIKGWRKFKMVPTRGVTITKMLAQATAVTQKPYKGAGKEERAEADLQATIDAFKAAIPLVVK